MKTGIFPKLGREEYDAATDRVNWSTLKHLGRSAEHYLYALGDPDAETPADDDTPARKLGRATHVAILEPELFGLLYVVWTGGRRAGKTWDAFQAAHADREILTADEYGRCVAMQKRVREHPTAGRYVVGGKAEVTIAWDHIIPAASDFPAIVTPMRGRLDYLRDDVIVDVKTTRDASVDGFGREVWTHRYHTQLALYQAGVEAITGRLLPVKIIAIENTAPHVVTVFDLPEHVLEIGREEFRALMAHLDWCKRESRWPGYADDEVELLLPRWAAPRPAGADEDLAGLDLAIGGE